MNGQPSGRRSARARAAAVAASSVVAALLGAALIATPAHAGTLTDAGDCLASTSTVFTALSGASSLAGAVTSTTDATTGVVSCTAGAVLGTGSSSAPARPVSNVEQPVTDGTDVDGTDPDVDTTATDATDDSTDDSTDATVTSASTGSASTLGSLSLTRSSNVVYPVKDGYLDSVKVGVRALDDDGQAVAVQGSAVLSKTDRSLKSWAVDGTASVISWDGRIGGAIRPGLYTLKVTAWSADGAKLTSSTHLRVLSKHLLKRALVVRSDVGARSVSADIPRQLLKAYAMGEVTIRIRTVARVKGSAKLVFRSTGGTVRSVALRNGTHMTPSLMIPAGFSHVTISHDWAKGTAHLRSLQAIWSYYTLS